MWELLYTPEMLPFSVTIILLFLLILLEILGFVFGGLGGFLDGLVPDGLVDTDIDADFSTDNMSLGLRFLDWLYVGRIPSIILLALWLLCFSFSGFLIQSLALSILGGYLSLWLASFDAFVVGTLLLRLVSMLIYPIMPKDETTAVSGSALIGRSAKIVLGEAKVGEPAQAKLLDEHGQTHYVMVEPDVSEMGLNQIIVLSADDDLILTKKVGERYLVKKLP